jgi:hypothetical protein
LKGPIGEKFKFFYNVKTKLAIVTIRQKSSKLEGFALTGQISSGMMLLPTHCPDGAISWLDMSLRDGNTN